MVSECVCVISISIGISIYYLSFLAFVVIEVVVTPLSILLKISVNKLSKSLRFYFFTLPPNLYALSLLFSSKYHYVLFPFLSLFFPNTRLQCLRLRLH